MESVTVTRAIDAPPEAIEAAMDDWAAFVRAAGFDGVDVTGETIRVWNAVGPAEIELELEVVADEDAALAYEQREGIFEEMWTGYYTRARVDDNGTVVEAVTTFEMAVPVVGGVLDSTVISRQRRRELEAQLEWLASTVA